MVPLEGNPIIEIQARDMRGLGLLVLICYQYISTNHFDKISYTWCPSGIRWHSDLRLDQLLQPFADCDVALLLVWHELSLPPQALPCAARPAAGTWVPAPSSAIAHWHSSAAGPTMSPCSSQLCWFSSSVSSYGSIHMRLFCPTLNTYEMKQLRQCCFSSVHASRLPWK